MSNAFTHIADLRKAIEWMTDLHDKQYKAALENMLKENNLDKKVTFKASKYYAEQNHNEDYNGTLFLERTESLRTPYAICFKPDNNPKSEILFRSLTAKLLTEEENVENAFAAYIKKYIVPAD